MVSIGMDSTFRTPGRREEEEGGRRKEWRGQRDD
jgi:hypothetical protein